METDTARLGVAHSLRSSRTLAPQQNWSTWQSDSQLSTQTWSRRSSKRSCRSQVDIKPWSNQSARWRRVSRLRSSAEQNLTARYKPTLKQKSRRCRSAGCLLCVLMNRCRLCLTAAARVLLLKCCCDLARAGLANSSASRGFGATTLDPKLSSLQEKMSSNYAELSGAFKTSLEGLARTVQDLHAIIKEERDQRRADIEHLASSLVSKVNECVAAIDEERVARVETETKTVRQVGQDMLRLQERLEAEKATRDGDINQLRSEIHEVLGNRNVSDEKFQAVVLDEVASLKVGTCSVAQHTWGMLWSRGSRGHLGAMQTRLLLM
eukprot:GHUV01050165.1.p1 GENE.GHUV01050165.1~~GHUV01050165.1.p1  ORF type:complete len:322 (+),score=61.78 GHUV01050165.1:181-1146(+)